MYLRYFEQKRPNRAVPFHALFLWQRFSHYNAVVVSKRILRFQRALSGRAFSFCTWKRSKVVSCAWWEQLESSNVTTDENLFWNFQQKMSLALRQTSQVFRSLSSTQTNVIIKTVVFIPESNWLYMTPGNSGISPALILSRLLKQNSKFFFRQDTTLSFNTLQRYLSQR